MRIVRFRAAGKTRYGALDGAQIVEYEGTPYGVFRKGRQRHALRQALLLPPVVPSKIVALECRYRDDPQGSGAGLSREPVMFLKPPSALIGPGDPIVVPAQVERVDYEGELAIVLKKRCRSVLPERAREHVLGYTCLNDVTARDLVVRDGHWTRAKSFDSFCPVGPCIATDIDPNGVEIESRVNGVARQASNTKHLVFPVEDIVARVSAVMTLMPGDVIATGTPAGAGPLVPKDLVEVRIEGIGCLTNPVVRI
jgi:2-keto-4-pentenoate hydratase/2-oxohepta-3-ene-1,7-dioic acid hydratase in catechol pathway